MKRVACAGGVVLLDVPFPAVVCVAHRSPVELRLPKGMVEPGESLQEAASRELLEETGIVATPGHQLGSASWQQRFADELMIKQVTYFLFDDPVWHTSCWDLDVRGLVLVSRAIACDLLSFEAERRIVDTALAARGIRS